MTFKILGKLDTKVIHTVIKNVVSIDLYLAHIMEHSQWEGGGGI